MKNSRQPIDYVTSAMMDRAQDGICIIRERVFRYVNIRLSEILGIPVDDLLNTSFLERLHPDEVAELERRWERCASGEEPSQRFDTVIVNKSGVAVDVEVTASLMDHETSPAVLVMVRDIRRRVKTESALEASEDRYRALVETTSDWIWEVDASGRYTYASPGVKSLLGYEPEEILGKTPFDLMPDEEARRVAAIFKDRLDQGLPLDAVENINIRKDGSRVVLETSGKPILDHEGNLIGYRGIDRDITERKETQKALRESEALLSSLVKNTPNFVTIVDSEYRITYINRTVAGSAPEEFIGRIVFDFIDSDHRSLAREKIDHVFNTGKPCSYVSEALGPHGTTSWYENHLGPILSGTEVTSVSIVAKDITDERTTQMALRASEANLAEAQRVASIGSFSWNLKSEEIYGSKETYGIYGWDPRKDTITMSLFEAMLHPEDHDEVLEALKESTTKGVPYNIDYRIILSDGEERVVHAQGEVETDDNGEPERMFGTVQDITERMLADKARRANEATLNSIFRAAPTGIGIVSNRVIKWINDRLTEMTGYSTDELVEQNARLLYASDEEFERVGREKYEMIEKLGTGTVETQWLTKSGQLIDVLLSSTPLNPKDLSVGVTFTALDITAKKEAERALRESEERYRSIFENTGTATVLFGNDYIITMCNSNYEKLSGYSKNEIQGKMKWTDFVSKADLERMKSYHKDRSEGKGSPPTEYYFDFIDRSGGIRNIHLKVGVIPGSSSRVASLNDITERKRAENVLRSLVESTATASEDLFFANLVRSLSSVLGVKYVFIGETFGTHNSHVRTLAVCAEGELVDDFEYRLEGTPCANVVARDLCYYPDRVTDLFPDDQMLGQMGVVSYLGTPLFDTKGQPLGLMAVMNDDRLPTPETAKDVLLAFAARAGAELERKLASAALIASEKRLRQVIDLVPHMVFAKDAEGKYLLVNRVMAESYNMTVEELTGKLHRDVHGDPVEVDRYLSDDREVILSGTTKFIPEENFVDSDGQHHIIQTVKIPFTQVESDVPAVLGVGVDITELKRVEEMLRHTSEELEKERQILTEKNIALKQVLGHIENEKHEIKVQVTKDLEEAIAPALKRIRDEAGDTLSGTLESLEANIEAILAKDIDVFKDRFSRLTPRESEICNLIKDGLSSKEISDMLNLSILTIQKHREQVRRKLGITNKKFSLATYLRSH